MYQIALKRPLAAQHFLIGGDWGAENHLHEHDYFVEWLLTGQELDSHGFLVDLVEMETSLENVLVGVRNRTLNDLAVFYNLNPSVERLCRYLSDNLLTLRPNWDPEFFLAGSLVKVFETEAAWASWSVPLARRQENS